MKLPPFLFANFSYNPFLFVFTLLEIPVATNGDFSMAGLIEKMGIIGVLAYLTHQQRTDNKESNKNWREEEAIIRKQFAEKEDRIIARYENLLTEQTKEHKVALQERDKMIQELHKSILDKMK